MNRGYDSLIYSLGSSIISRFTRSPLRLATDISRVRIALMVLPFLPMILADVRFFDGKFNDQGMRATNFIDAYLIG